MDRKGNFASGGGGRGRGGGGYYHNNPGQKKNIPGNSKGSSSKALVFRTFDVHSEQEFDQLIDYSPSKLPPADMKYYHQCVNDLKAVLTAYNGVRLRFIRGHFLTRCGTGIDFGRLNLKGWSHFLLTCPFDVEFKLYNYADKDKEGVYAFPREMEGMEDDTALIRDMPEDAQMTTVDACEAFLKGFLDEADGQERLDPRVPMQDMGVAATETMHLIKSTNMSFEDQIRLANKNNPTVTVETMNPIANPKTTTSLKSFFESCNERQDEEIKPVDIFAPKPEFLGGRGNRF